MEKKLKPITWKTFRPDSFPCIVCGEDEAVYIRHENGFYLPVCLKCAERPWDEIMETMKLEREEEVNMKYTPGPWVREHGIFVIAKCNPFKTDSGVIRKLTICRTDNPHMPESEQGANASLIAAAPELLEACKEALEALHNLMPDEHMKKANCWNPSEYEKCPCTSCKLKRVIAKAEGKEP